MRYQNNPMMSTVFWILLSYHEGLNYNSHVLWHTFGSDVDTAQISWKIIVSLNVIAAAIVSMDTHHGSVGIYVNMYW